MTTEIGPGSCPAHLEPLVRVFADAGGWEAFTGVLAGTVDGERETIWQRIDYCAAADLVFDFEHNPKLLGEVAGVIGKHKETARRYVKVGQRFPPSIPVHDADGKVIVDPQTGEVQQTYFRQPDEAVNLYLEAVSAKDPQEALLTARKNKWSAQQLRKNIRSGSVPSAYRELAARKCAAPFDIEAVLDEFERLVLEKLAEFQAQGATVESIRFHASASLILPEGEGGQN